MGNVFRVTAIRGLQTLTTQLFREYGWAGVATLVVLLGALVTIVVAVSRTVSRQGGRHRECLYAGWTSISPARTVSFLAVIFLLTAAGGRWPYVFYVVLRVFIAASCLFLLRLSWKRFLPVWPYLFGAIAVLYQPLQPIHMRRDGWVIVNLLTAVVVLVFVASQFWAGFSNAANRHQG